MRAMVIKTFGGTEVFEQRDVPKPVPEPKQVLIRVFATSVNPLDYQTRRGDYAASVRLPAILGSDVSGVVEDVGGAVTDFKVGDEVYYTPQIFGGDGSYAEYHVADESIIARKPRNISHSEAASLSLTGGTAWEALVTRGRLQVGESILIHAGAGGVGSIAIQLAKAIGANVFATCSGQNADFVRSLGADYVIDYQSEDYVEVVRRETSRKGVDFIFDTIGGDTIERSPLAMSESGRLATIVDIPKPQSLLEHWGKNTTIHFVFTQQNRAKLDALRALIERGQIRPLVDSIIPIGQVAKAHARVEQGGVRGKVVLDVNTFS
ncbi:zinc-dependent alcohol dehydrogenase family protein [Roseiconus nitratireducens]|uniref:Zinc-dependent alcohol dehydrogenase family protein n=1 Tax=Roseiconus nitratireducens TaxID=2605748 RepID=A0A5M6CY24_9BACT|nr:zinc-dependent alcohol dehydrogenase family protein [Roseiconus nitratireducens]KAA5540003.1 zinc-dependent alcohol dehydrogenase family protein [Roseiconus nitratireducens]